MKSIFYINLICIDVTDTNNKLKENIFHKVFLLSYSTKINLQ